MKLRVKGEGDVSLSDKDFVAEGGEGRVYARGAVGYKVYHDPTKAIPLAKIQELSGILNPEVIKPDKPVYGGRGGLTHVGHTFRFVKDTVVLCQLFTRAFREREGFTHEMALKLVRRIQEGVSDVHHAGVLLVDLNEMNFLVSQDLTTPYFIDVDSYQTAHFPATAIMPSVRDWKTEVGKFTEFSDWFSFAIVSFQLLVGIHPFKGKHPTIKGLEERMQKGISVFDPQVKVPSTCYSFDVIPPAYRDWYRALFVNGSRHAPPSDIHGAILVQTIVKAIQGSGNLDIQEIAEYAQDLRLAVKFDAQYAVCTKDALFLDRRRIRAWDGQAVFASTPRNGRVVAATIVDGSLSLTDLTSSLPLEVTLRADDIMGYEGRLYVKTGEHVYEVTFTESANKTWVTAEPATHVLPHASKLYEGMVLQNLLGEPHATFFPRTGTTYQSKLPELRGHKVVSAKFDRGVLMVIAAQGGTYDRFVFRFDEEFSSYDTRVVKDIPLVGINFVTLDSGICVCMDEEERLEVFSARKGSSGMKLVDDDALGGDMRLVKDHGRLAFYRKNRMYSMRMK